MTSPSSASEPRNYLVSSEAELIELGTKIFSSIVGRKSEKSSAASLESAGYSDFAATDSVPAKRVFELIGDVGAGKTTFTKGLARALGIKDEITSPSFMISKTYAIPDSSVERLKTLVHYDFYRLGDPGLMSDDLSENLADSGAVIVVEWGGSVENLLPEDRTVVKITTLDDGSRRVEVS